MDTIHPIHWIAWLQIGATFSEREKTIFPTFVDLKPLLAPKYETLIGELAF